MIIKMMSERKGQHVHERVFVADGEDKTFALAGTLVFRIGEWQLFGAALGLGAANTQGRLRVVFVGDEEVCKEVVEK